MTVHQPTAPRLGVSGLGVVRVVVGQGVPVVSWANPPGLGPQRRHYPLHYSPRTRANTGTGVVLVVAWAESPGSPGRAKRGRRERPIPELAVLVRAHRTELPSKRPQWSEWHSRVRVESRQYLHLNPQLNRIYRKPSNLPDPSTVLGPLIYRDHPTGAPTSKLHPMVPSTSEGVQILGQTKVGCWPVSCLSLTCPK